MADDPNVHSIGLIGASFETGNMGVGALAAGAIRCIHRQWPTADIFILDYARVSSKRSMRLDGEAIEVPLHNMRFSKTLFLWNNIVVLIACLLLYRLIPLRALRESLSSRHPTIQAIISCDLFASIAGGDSFSDIYGIRRFFYVALPQILIILAGKKLILLPQTYGPFRGRVARVVTSFIACRADRIYARDYRSIAALEQLYAGKRSVPKASFRYDVGFALEPVASLSMKVDGGLDLSAKQPVGLNVSGLLYMGGYNRANMFGLQLDYPEFIHKIIHLLMKRGASVLLIPHVFGTKKDSESDVLACEAVYQACAEKYPGRLGLLRGEYDQGEIKEIIGRCEFFIGSRMHACIAAISQSVPTVAVAYSEKFIGVMETAATPAIVADARKLSLEEMLAYVIAQYGSREALQEYLNRVMPDVTRAALHTFDDAGPSEPKVFEWSLPAAAENA
ncbi:polysaccharide pyruvyl transferase family protein [Silvibacterium acidisoli]|uniref:polysaccharide pyruvyl transferase family protein n=1 Tax=Acidobacteriaceae bacterium ZG23-2 TaxID=2883246 RepID=UPI00406C7978